MPRKPLETRPGRMEPLSRLPVFFALKGKRAILAGGHAGAAWKAELLSSTGVDLDVYAEHVEPEMEAVIASPPAGRITLHRRQWTQDDFAGAAIAIGGIEDEAEGRAFFDAAHAAGVPVNVIDKPDLCDFAFGGIVNRSPLVIGISTDGAAPVFGQAIRAKIETMLPVGLTLWARAAQAWRPAVQALGLSFQGRRRFWERFTDAALADPNATPEDRTRDAILAKSVEEASQPELGAVTLVGAGPGDPELLTLKAVRVLQSADIVLYDDLVSPEVLAFARREARTMLVGKKGHGPSCKQTDINDLMVSLAREGHKVVRLKSGDPMVFGRAAEEIDACRHAGVSVEIVPGITTAQGAAASLKRSLTHRGLARRVQFVTGHDHRGKLPSDLEWVAIADPAATTVVYMPAKTIGVLADNAMAHGLSPDLPAVAIFNATRSNEHVIEGTLRTIAGQITKAGLNGPVIVLLGHALTPGDITEAAALALDDAGTSAVA